MGNSSDRFDSSHQMMLHLFLNPSSTSYVPLCGMYKRGNPVDWNGIKTFPVVSFPMNRRTPGPSVPKTWREVIEVMKNVTEHSLQELRRPSRSIESVQAIAAHVANLV